MNRDDDHYAAHCEMFRKAGFSAEAVARARESAARQGASCACMSPTYIHDVGCPLYEPTTSELPAVLEKHASRLAELGHYDIAADVQLASEILSREVSGG